MHIVYVLLINSYMKSIQPCNYFVHIGNNVIKYI